MSDDRSAPYALGGSEVERARLRTQAGEHEGTARRLLEQVGVSPGWRVLDVGCGPIGILALLAELVGPEGQVVGLEREKRFAEMANDEIAQQGLHNVVVVQGDALTSGLEPDSFDLVHERLVLVNVPERRRLVGEMLSLAKPGGVVALEDIDNISWTCEPMHESWAALLQVFHQTFQSRGGDPFVGRRLPSLLAAAGVPDVHVEVHAALPRPGEYRRTHLLSLIESIRDNAVGSAVVTEDELDRHAAALLEHLDDPATVVVDKLLFQCWGHKPA